MTRLTNQTLEKLFSELTVQLDSKDFDKILDRYFSKGITPTIYIEENDTYAFNFYKDEVKKSSKEIKVATMPAKPDAEFVKSVKDEAPGVVNSVLIVNDEGIFGTPYVASGHPHYDIESYPSYFIVLGLLALDNITLARQIAGNIIYQVGHTHTFKPTNRIEHQAVTASPVYTTLVKQIAMRLPSEDERRKFLPIHSKRSILEYNRTWNTPESLLDNGLNVYPSNKAKEEANIPVKLNAMLFKMERDIAHFIQAHTENQILEVEGVEYTPQFWIDKSNARLEKINEVLWNESNSTFNDYSQKKQEFINLDRADFIYALWAKAATKEQADLILEKQLDDFTENGIFDYKQGNSVIETPEQILFWIGLKNYKKRELLDKYTASWTNLAEETFAAHGSLPQHLTPSKEAGEHSFGWTIAAYAIANSMKA